MIKLYSIKDARPEGDAEEWGEYFIHLLSKRENTVTAREMIRRETMK